MSLNPEFRLLKKSDAARIFDVCLKTIDNYILGGLLPAPVEFGSKQYWHPEEFEAFISQAFRRSPTPEDAASVAPSPTNAADGERARSARRPASKRHSAASSKAHPAARALTRQHGLLGRLNQEAAEANSAPRSQEP